MTLVKGMMPYVGAGNVLYNKAWLATRQSRVNVSVSVYRRQTSLMFQDRVVGQRPDSGVLFVDSRFWIPLDTPSTRLRFVVRAKGESCKTKVYERYAWSR